jgi:hypothetical protein
MLIHILMDTRQYDAVNAFINSHLNKLSIANAGWLLGAWNVSFAPYGIIWTQKIAASLAIRARWLADIAGPKACARRSLR